MKIPLHDNAWKQLVRVGIELIYHVLIVCCILYRMYR